MPKPSDAEIKVMQARLGSLAVMIENLHHQEAQLGMTLAPVWEKERNVIDRIRNTHGTGATFNPHTAPKRTPLFEALLQIAVEHGKTKNQYRDVKRQAKAYANEMARIERELAK